MNSIRKLLEGLSVADLSVGMAGALSTKFLVDVGARVRKLEPPGGDPFYERYAAHATWQVGKTITRARHLANTDEIDAVLSGADVCVIGGEDHPDLHWRLDTENLLLRKSHILFFFYYYFIHISISQC